MKSRIIFPNYKNSFRLTIWNVNKLEPNLIASTKKVLD